MGAFDNLYNLSDAQAITAAAASSNYCDMVATKPQIGVGKTLMLCIRTAVAPTQATDTLSIEVQVDDNSSFTSAKTVFMPLVGAAGAEVLASDARLDTAGDWIWRACLPYGINERYLRLYYNNTTTVGTFTIDAWLEEVAQSDLGEQVFVSNVGNP